MPDSELPATITVEMALQRHPALGRNRVYQGMASGGLRSVKAGRRRAFSVPDLDAWVAAGCPIHVVDRSLNESADPLTGNPGEVRGS